MFHRVNKISCDIKTRNRYVIGGSDKNKTKKTIARAANLSSCCCSHPLIVGLLFVIRESAPICRMLFGKRVKALRRHSFAFQEVSLIQSSVVICCCSSYLTSLFRFFLFGRVFCRSHNYSVMLLYFLLLDVSAPKFLFLFFYKFL